MILPPLEIRVIVEKLAAHVAKNGAAFETKILEKERSNPRFSFLFKSDPYNEYYMERLSAFTSVSCEDVDAVLAQSHVLAEAQRLRLQHEAQDQHAGAPSEPIVKVEHFFHGADAPMASQDAAVLLYTALHVAVCGREFELALRARETQNAQFAFLRDSSGPLRRAYQDALRQYRRLLCEPVDMPRDIASLVGNRRALLERARALAMQKRAARGAADAGSNQESEQLAYAVIDWDSFVVIDHLDFSSDVSSLPRLLVHDSVKGLSAAQREALFSGDLSVAQAPETRKVSLTDVVNALCVDFSNVEHPTREHLDGDGSPSRRPSIDLHSDERRPKEVQVESRDSSPPPYGAAPGTGGDDVAAAMDPRGAPLEACGPFLGAGGSVDRARSEQAAHARQDGRAQGASTAAASHTTERGVRIREAYVPKGARSAADVRVRCPICGDSFHADAIAEHMRVEALDPKWHEQRQRYLAKHRDTNLVATGTEVVQALEAMHERRALEDERAVLSAPPAATSKRHLQPRADSRSTRRRGQ